MGDGETGGWGLGAGKADAPVVRTEETDADLIYEPIWSFNPAEEKKAFEKFIAGVMEPRHQYPDMHIYHYSQYEPTAIRHLAGRHGVCTNEVDELFFVDLLRVVRQGLRAC